MIYIINVKVFLKGVNLAVYVSISIADQMILEILSKGFGKNGLLASRH